jgi:hypothetical protein
LELPLANLTGGGLVAAGTRRRAGAAAQRVG